MKQKPDKNTTLLLKQVPIFIALFLLLQLLWSLFRNSAIGWWFIEGATVSTAGWLINLLSPGVGVSTQGTYINATGGGINVVNGCEGIEVMFILIAAMCIAPINWRAKIAGMLTGIIYVFLMNQVRLVAMFYAVRANKRLFETVHSLVGPILLVAVTSLFFAFWLSTFSKTIKKVDS